MKQKDMLSQFLSNYIKMQGYTQESFAEHVGYSVDAVKSWCSGRRRPPLDNIFPVDSTELKEAKRIYQEVYYSKQSSTSNEEVMNNKTDAPIPLSKQLIDSIPECILSKTDKILLFNLLPSGQELASKSFFYDAEKATLRTAFGMTHGGIADFYKVFNYLTPSELEKCHSAVSSQELLEYLPPELIICILNRFLWLKGCYASFYNIGSYPMESYKLYHMYDVYRDTRPCYLSLDSIYTLCTMAAGGTISIARWTEDKFNIRKNVLFNNVPTCFSNWAFLSKGNKDNSQFPIGYSDILDHLLYHNIVLSQIKKTFVEKLQKDTIYEKNIYITEEGKAFLSWYEMFVRPYNSKKISYKKESQLMKEREELLKRNNQSGLIVSENHTLCPEYSNTTLPPTLVFGGPRSGKTFAFIEPNLLQFNGNYVVTDHNGILAEKYSSIFERHGYNVKVVYFGCGRESLYNRINENYFCSYNPFAYIKTDKDIEIMANLLFPKTDDTFYFTFCQYLLKAFVGYVHDCLPASCQDLPTLARIVQEYAEDLLAGHKLFLKYEKEHPNTLGVRSYQIVYDTPQYTLKGFLQNILTVINEYKVTEPDGRPLFYPFDSLNLQELSTAPTILFLELPTNKPELSPIFALMLTHILQDCITQRIKEKAQDFESLPIHFILDEFQNIQAIPNFLSYLAMSQGCSLQFSMICQEPSQISQIYDNDIFQYIANILCMSNRYMSEKTLNFLYTSLNPAECFNVSSQSQVSITKEDLLNLSPEMVLCATRKDINTGKSFDEFFIDKKYLLNNHINYTDLI